MFDKLTGMHSLIKQATEMGRQMKQINEQLANQTVEAIVGAGMVTVTADGKGEVRRVSIDPELLKPEEREMLEELVVSGVNEAGRKARELAKAEMSKLTGGVDVAGMFGFS